MLENVANSQGSIKLLNNTSPNLNKSYFIKMDTRYGWGVGAYFSFWGEFQRPSEWLKILEVVLVSLIFLVGISCNLAILVILYKRRKYKTVASYFVASLAIGGILLSSTLPLVAVTRITESWVLGAVACSLNSCLAWAAGFIIIWTQTFISIERHLYLKRPIVKELSKGAAILMTTLLWIICIAACMPIGIFFVLEDFPLGDRTVTLCTLVWPKTEVRISFAVTIPMVICGFVFPICIITYNYFSILYVMVKSTKRVTKIEGTTPIHISCLMWNRRRQNEIRVVKLLVSTVVLFVITFLPIFVCFVLILYDGLTGKLVMTSQAYLAGTCIAALNACVNPMMYGVINKKMFSHLKCCRNVKKIFSHLNKSCSCESKQSSSCCKQYGRNHRVHPQQIFVLSVPKNSQV